MLCMFVYRIYFDTLSCYRKRKMINHQHQNKDVLLLSSYGGGLSCNMRLISLISSNNLSILCLFL